MTTIFSFDSQPYAVLEDNRRLGVVSFPGRASLLQRITVNIGDNGATPPDRLRVLLRSEGDQPPANDLEIRVTNLQNQNLVVPRRVPSSMLRRPRFWQWVEIDLEPSALGWSTVASEQEILVWFSATGRGVGWEISAPSTGENVRRWRGPDPDNPTFAELLSFPTSRTALARVSGAALVPEIGRPVSAVADGSDVIFGSEAGSNGFRRLLSRRFGIEQGNYCVTAGTNHLYYGTFTGGTPYRIRKVAKSDMRSVAQTTAPLAGGFGAATSRGDQGFFCTLDTPIGLYRYNLNDNNSNPVELSGLNFAPAGTRTGVAIDHDGTFVYVGSRNTPARITKFNMDTMQVAAGSPLTLASGRNNTEGLVVRGNTATGKMWVATESNHVVEIALSTFSVTREIFLGSQYGQVSCIDASSDGSFLVVGTRTGAAVRISTTQTNLEVVGASSFGVSAPFRKIRIDSEDTYAYALTNTRPAIVERIALGLMAPLGSFTFPANCAFGEDFVMDDRRIYAGFSDFREARIARVDTSTTVVSRVNGFSLANSPIVEIPAFDSFIVSGIVRGTGSTIVSSLFPRPRLTRYSDNGTRTDQMTAPQGILTMVADDDHVFLALASSPANTIRKVSRSNFSSFSDLVLDPGEVGIFNIALGDNYLYAATGSNVIKIEKASNQRENQVGLSNVEGGLLSATVDGDFAYFGSGGLPAKIYKVTMNDGSNAAPVETDVLTLQPGEGQAVALSVRGDSLFVLTDRSPAQVIEIDLVNFERKTAVTLLSNEPRGQSLVSTGTNTFAGVGDTVGRVVKIGLSQQQTAKSHALQIDEQSEIFQLTSRNVRKDADVSVQLGKTPATPFDISLGVVDGANDTNCVSGVEISWSLGDEICDVFTSKGFVEIQRQTSKGLWQTVFRVTSENIFSVVDYEVGRNANNVYRLRVMNDAGFISEWSPPQEVFVPSDCCGYVFSYNGAPGRSLWYDDVAERRYNFPQSVTYVEFEGQDGAVALAGDSDRLDEFSTELLVTGFGVSGGTVNAATLQTLGRRLFDPLLELVGNKRDAGGSLARYPYISVADSEGNVWKASVEVRDGDRVATAGRHTLRVFVREITRDPEPVVVGDEVSAPGDSGFDVGVEVDFDDILNPVGS